MKPPRIVDRGDGPKIEGTRITVYTVLEYQRLGRPRDWIAATLNLSSPQVQAAMDYIREHEAQVAAEYPCKDPPGKPAGGRAAVAGESRKVEGATCSTSGRKALTPHDLDHV